MSRSTDMREPNCQIFRRPASLVQTLLVWTIWATLAPSIGCIVPVAPEFQDPAQAPNFYPYFHNTEPFQERTVTIGAGYPFVVSVGDQNLGDTLYVRWVSDYPPFLGNASKVLSDGPNSQGRPISPNPPTTRQPEVRPPIEFMAQCEAFAPSLSPVHRLVVIVADRPFLNAPTFSGDLRYNQVGTRADDLPVTYPIMAGWNVVCPQ